MDTYLECVAVDKTYEGTVRALQDVSLTVAKGEVHAIIGENGAGKSTLAKILGGLIKPDSGSIRLEGKEYRPNSPRDAHSLGIGMVHQHFTLFPPLTIAENIILGREPTRAGRIDMVRAVREVARLSEQYGMPFDPRRCVEELSVGEKQRVEILKALYRDVELLILDEPTAVLTPQEVEKLFKGIRRLMHEGYTVILIAHKLEEVLSIADRITVLRRGRVVGSVAREQASKAELVRMMVGADIALDRQRPFGRPRESVLQLRRLSLNGEGGRKLLDEIDLDVHGGEIVGIAGVEGNGQDELEGLLGGLLKPSGGTVTLAGSDITSAPPRERRARGLAYVPADRMEWGCAPLASVFDNSISQSYRGSGPLGILGRSRLRRQVASMFERFDVRTPGLAAPISSLSGGNIQKLILGRELGRSADLAPKAILISKPTRGIDIRGVEFIHDLLDSYREAGSAILLISTDLDEIIALSDRIAVLYRGRLVALLPGSGKTGREELGNYMLQGASIDGAEEAAEAEQRLPSLLETGRDEKAPAPHDGERDGSR